MRFMLSDREQDALDGIRLNIEAIRSFVEGVTVEQFASDLRTFYAVTRALEIISEASRRLPDDLKARYPEVRWGAIRGAGNVYRHAYSQVSSEFIWDTATAQLDGLWEVVIKETAADPEHVEAYAIRDDGSDKGSKP